MLRPDFLAHPTFLLSCLTTFIGFLSLLGLSSRYFHSSTGRILAELPSIYVTLSGCRPRLLLFAHYAHQTGMISLSHEQELLWLKREPLPSLALHFGTTFLPRNAHAIQL